MQYIFVLEILCEIINKDISCMLSSMMIHDVLLHLGKLASLVTTCFTICAVRVGVTADRSAPAGKVAIARVMAIYGLQPKHSHIKTWHEGKVCGKKYTH